MTRGVSAAAKAYSGPVFWTVDITALDGTNYYYWTGAKNRTIDSNVYQPYLRIPTGFRLARSLYVDSGEIELISTDYSIETILASKILAGGLCIVKQFLIGIDERVEIMRGRLSEQQRRIDSVRFRLVAEFEPGQIVANPLEYSALCRWRFAKPPCGYLWDSISVTENVAERTANIYSSNTIGDSGLSETVDAHIDRFVLITNGTGKGQARRILSNTATTFTLYQNWETTPDGTSKFRVVTAANGIPKQLFTSTSALDIATANIHTSRTIGLSTLSMTVDEHKSSGPDEDAGLVRIVGGTGSGQERKIQSNTATTITIGADEDDFSPTPDSTSQFRVLYLRCPKDIAEACERRGKTHRFNGAPTVSPDLARIYNPATGSVPIGGGGAGGGAGDDDRTRMIGP